MLTNEVQELMRKYLNKFSRIQPTIHQLSGVLQIRTQTANQTTEFGKLKFLGQETVWLQLKYPNKRPIVLARLTELREKDQYEYETPYLEQYEEVVQKHLSAIQKIVT